MAFIGTIACYSLKVSHSHLEIPSSSSLRRDKVLTWNELFLSSWDEIYQTKLTRNLCPKTSTSLFQMRGFYSVYMDDYSSHMLRRISLPWSSNLGSRDTLRDRWRKCLIFLHEYLNTLRTRKPIGEVYSHTFLISFLQFKWENSHIIILLNSFHWTYNFNV